jgi:hypothetical protein
MRALLASLVFTFSAVAQSSIDPYEFLSKKDLHNADVNQRWRRLGVSGKIRETGGNGSKDTSKTFRCDPDDQCEAELLWHHRSLLSSDADGEDEVVRVSPKGGYYDLNRFLVFRLEEKGWRLVDYLDSTNSHYDTAEALIVNSGGKRWVVVNSYPRCGTGCSLNPSDWYELKNGKFRLVLSVPLSGHEGEENPGRYFESRFVRAIRTDALETLEFVFHVEFRPSLGSSIQVSNLFEDENLIRFSRPVGQGEFKFDAKNSEASEAFVDEIFTTSEEVNQPRIFRLMQNHLLAIARGPNDQRRRWLKELLDENPNLPELAPVRAAFAKVPAADGRPRRDGVGIPDRK